MGPFSIRSDFLPLSRPSFDAELLEAVTATLASGWITTGPRTQEFEERFATFTGARHALALASATAGLHLGLLALGLEEGDEVITPSITWASAVNMVELLGGRPVFVDIDLDTLQIDTDAVESVVSDRTVGIIPVHFAGAPCDMDALERIALAHGLWIFEDSAHAVGTTYRGKHVSNGRHLGVFSFHPIKNMTTIEGGMLTTDDDELASRLRRLRFHGLEKSAWDRYSEGGKPQVEIVEPGFKYNFTDVQSTVGLHQLAAVEGFNQRRRELAALYDRRLDGIPGIVRPCLPSYDHVSARHLYVIRVEEPSGLTRDELIEALRERNVGTGIHFRAVHTQPYYAETYPQWLGKLPSSERASEGICSLPLFPGMTEEDVTYVASAIEDAVRPS